MNFTFDPENAQDCLDLKNKMGQCPVNLFVYEECNPPLLIHDALIIPSSWLPRPKPGYCVMAGGFVRTFRNKRKAEKYAKKRYANPW